MPYLKIAKDYETCERAGDGGAYQIKSLTYVEDYDNETDITHEIDFMRHFPSEDGYKELREHFSKQLGHLSEQLGIDVSELDIKED